MNQPTPADRLRAIRTHLVYATSHLQSLAIEFNAMQQPEAAAWHDAIQQAHAAVGAATRHARWCQDSFHAAITQEPEDAA